MPDPDRVHRLVGQAHDSLRAADVLLGEGLATRSVSESYYAMLRAARALLLLAERDPRTHRGTADLLWTEFVEPGELDGAHVKAFREAMELREEVDYGTGADVGDERARDLRGQARRFVERVEEVLGEAGL